MPGVWLDRFIATSALSHTAGFELVGATDVRGDRRVVVVASREGADRDAAAAALDRLHAAHRAPRHPVIAAAIERGEHAGVGYVIFDFPARLDLEELLTVAAESGVKAEPPAADGLNATLRDALLASDARLGTLVLSNLLFAADGRWALVGFGHNVCAYDEHGRLVPRRAFFQAPEVAAGAPPTMTTDFVAVVRMSRQIMAFVNMPEAIMRCLTGKATPADLALASEMLRFETQVVHGTPDQRPPMSEILQLSERIRRLVGVQPDPESFRAAAAAIISRSRPEDSTRVLALARDSAWFELDGQRSALSPLLGRLLRALAVARVQHPLEPISLATLLEAGWPGERMREASARNRLHVAINGLRKSGLGDLIESDATGYRLAPSLSVRLDAEA